MPDIAWNVAVWDGGHNWDAGGEEWSVSWGGSEPQWFGSLYPRLHRFLPTRTILEIAPGYGRWTKFLIPNCKRYIGVDLSQECVDSCRRIFSNVRRATFIKNDGLSLYGIKDRSCDFVFSFDSLVHADAEIIESYIPEILRILSRTGAAFIHHSSMLGIPCSPEQQKEHYRSLTVSADSVARGVAAAGGGVMIQEIVNWSSGWDCLTLFRRTPNSNPVRIHNPRFSDEAVLIRASQAAWSALESPMQIHHSRSARAVRPKPPHSLSTPPPLRSAQKCADDR